MSEIVDHIKELTKTVNRMQQEILALGAVNHLLTEIAFEANPKFKSLVADALQQVLDKPGNTYSSGSFLTMIRALQKAAQNPTRLTSDGRRQWLKILRDDKK